MNANGIRSTRVNGCATEDVGVMKGRTVDGKYAGTVRNCHLLALANTVCCLVSAGLIRTVGDL